MNNYKETLKNRRDHYVLQVYLRNFACNEKKMPIWMMDKREKKILRKTFSVEK